MVKKTMDLLPLETRYDIIQQLPYLFTSHSPKTMLETNSDGSLTCSLGELLLWCTVCSEWHTFFCPLLSEIVKNPINWALKQENKKVFIYWLNIARQWADGINNNKTIYVYRFISQHKRLYNLKPIETCTTRAKEFSFAVFSAAGIHNISEQFLKYIWLHMHNRNFFHLALGDYYQSLIFCGKQSNVSISKSDRQLMREDLLNNNAYSNILYYIDRYYTWKREPYTLRRQICGMDI